MLHNVGGFSAQNFHRKRNIEHIKKTATSALPDNLSKPLRVDVIKEASETSVVPDIFRKVTIVKVSFFCKHEKKFSTRSFDCSNRDNE